MDDIFLIFLKARSLRCVRRDPSPVVRGLSYCATEGGKTMLCFIQWPKETDQSSVYFIDGEIQPDGADWVCGQWRIELNSPLDDDLFTEDLAGLRREEKNTPVDFDANMALAQEVLDQAIERFPEQFV